MPDALRNGIDLALLAFGHQSVHDLTREDVVIPDSFVQRLGT